jgi:hypothetical protein
MGNPRQHTLGEKLRSPYLWHRWAGLVLAALLVWAAVTGMVLNHEAELDLGARPVRSAWLLDAWDVPEPVLGAAYPTRLGWVVAVDGTTWLHDELLPGGPLVGALDDADGTLIVTQELLHLYGPDGALIERFAPELTPVRAFGHAPDGRLAMHANSPLMLADSILGEWHIEPIEARQLRPVATAVPPAATANALRTEARARGLTWDRVVRDLHAGHVPARWLRWVLDLVALGLIALALTGVWIHLQRRKH